MIKLTNNNLRTAAFAAGFGLLTVMMVATSAFAYSVENTGVELKGDFVLEPAKVEISLAPGSSATRTINITNRTDRVALFKLEVEDFAGSRDPKVPVVLLGGEIGPYSLKDFIRPEVQELTLSPGQRATVSINISVPEDVEPGGRYGSVVVSTSREAAASENNIGAEGRTLTVSRLAALFFLKVDGDVEENGQLADFRISGSEGVRQGPPSSFEVLYTNNGNVHLVPSGKIEVKNMLGASVGQATIQPFFVMPDSLRSSEVNWQSNFMLGRYTATAQVNRGYVGQEDIIDEKTITFWVMPWKLVVGLLLSLVLVTILIRYVRSRFEIRRK